MLSHLSKVGRSFLSSSFFDFDLDFLDLEVELFVRFTAAAAAEVDARAILGEPTSCLVTPTEPKRSTSRLNLYGMARADTGVLFTYI